MNNINRLYRRRIGEILVAEGVISASQLEEALAIQKKTGELLGAILLDMKLVTEAEIAKTICTQYQLPFLSLANYEFDQKLVKLFPADFLMAHHILPFDKVGDTLLVMIAEVPGEDILKDIPRVTKVSSAALYVGLLSEIQTELARLLGLPKIERTGAKAGPQQPSGKRPEAPKADKAPAPQKVTRAKQAASVAADSDSTLDPEVAQLLELDEQTEDLVASLGEEVAESREDEESSGEDVADAEELDEKSSLRKAPDLVFGESTESFLKALDSTWDSIFPGAPSEEDDSG